jgi:hypothetical protein
MQPGTACIRQSDQALVGKYIQASPRRILQITTRHGIVALGAPGDDCGGAASFQETKGF